MVTVLLLVTACSETEQPDATQENQNNQALTVFGRFPASYEGVLPCADCLGIYHEVNLHADGTYYFNSRYIGKDGSRYITGNWQLEDDGSVLVLQRTDNSDVYFAVQNQDTLEMLDKMGRPIPSSLNYQLQRFANE